MYRANLTIYLDVPNQACRKNKKVMGSRGETDRRVIRTFLRIIENPKRKKKFYLVTHTYKTAIQITTTQPLIKPFFLPWNHNNNYILFDDSAIEPTPHNPIHPTGNDIR
jgi:hypothetical protein